MGLSPTAGGWLAICHCPTAVTDSHNRAIKVDLLSHACCGTRLELCGVGLSTHRRDLGQRKVKFSSTVLWWELLSQVMCLVMPVEAPHSQHKQPSLFHGPFQLQEVTPALSYGAGESFTPGSVAAIPREGLDCTNSHHSGGSGFHTASLGAPKSTGNNTKQNSQDSGVLSLCSFAGAGRTKYHRLGWLKQYKGIVS